MFGEIRVPLDRNCVPNSTENALIVSGSVGKIVGLVADELKRSGHNLSVAGTSSLHELAIYGEDVQVLHKILQTSSMQILLQAVSPQVNKLLPIDAKARMLTKAVGRARNTHILKKHQHQAEQRGDNPGARKIRRQQEISQRQIFFYLTQGVSSGKISFEEAVREYIGKVIEESHQEEYSSQNLQIN